MKILSTSDLKLNEYIFSILFSFYVLLTIFLPTVWDATKLLLLSVMLILTITITFRITQKNLSILFCILIIYNTIQTIIGFPKFGNIALENFQVFVIYFSLYFYFSYFFKSKTQLEMLDKAIYLGGFLLNLYFFYCFLGITYKLPFYFGDFLEQNFQIPKDVNIIKVYALNVLSYFYLLPYFIIDFIYSFKNKKINKFKLINLLLTLIAVLITLRRGTIVASIFSTIIVLYLMVKNKLVFIKYLIIIFISIVFTMVFAFSLNKNTSVQRFKQELVSSFNFKVDRQKNRSNTIRTEQFQKLYSAWLEKPVFGHGLGAYFKNYRRSKTDPSNFELQYMKILYNTGLIGFLIISVFYITILISAYKTVKYNLSIHKFIFPALAGNLCVVISNAFNPLLTQLSILFTFFHLIYILNVSNCEKRMILQSTNTHEK